MDVAARAGQPVPGPGRAVNTTVRVEYAQALKPGDVFHLLRGSSATHLVLAIAWTHDKTIAISTPDGVIYCSPTHLLLVHAPAV